MKYIRPYWKWFEFSKSCYLGFVQEMTNIASGKLIIWGLKRSHRTSSKKDHQLLGAPGFFENIWYGWWQPEIWRENQLRLEVFPVIYQVFVTQDFFHPPYDWKNQVTKNSSKRMGTGEFATFFVVTFTFGFYKLTWWQHKSPIPTKHLHMHKTCGIWHLNLPYFGLSYYPHWIRWSKKSPTGPTKRTPKKPEYLIARSQLT